MKFLILLSVHLVLVLQVSGQTECRRRPPIGADCSTVTADCFIPTQEGPMPIPFPEENTQSCYRTCIVPDNTCEVNRIVFENMPLQRSPPTTDRFSVTRLTSPNFLKQRSYRRSTICRYHAACSPEQLLVYAISSHEIERPVVCGGEQVCVDSLTVSVGNTPPTVSCGVKSNGDLMFANSGPLLVEFQSNRRIEDRGFEILVSCINASVLDIIYDGTERRRRDNHVVAKVHSSDTDKEIIVRLMKRMAVEISDDEELDMVDVYGRASRRESPRVTPAEDQRLQEDALRYDTGSNGLLRATACAYQQLILGRKCSI